MFTFLVFLVVTVLGFVTPEPNTILPLPTQYSFLHKFFTKYLNIFGVNIFAEEKVPDWMVKHAGNIMAQYLDFKGTGAPTNTRVVYSMLEVNASLVMFYNPDSMNAERAFRALDRHGMQGQDLDYVDIPDWVPHVKKVGADDFDASLEEILHLITDAGYSRVYPDQFATQHGSALMNTMDEMIADCGWSFNNTFKYPHCKGKYHYSDETCDYSCLGTEYFMWSLTTLLGGQDGSHNDATASRCEDINDEWEMCTPELLKKYDPKVVELYGIDSTNPWLLPDKLPDGHYKPNKKVQRVTS